MFTRVDQQSRHTDQYDGVQQAELRNREQLCQLLELIEFNLLQFRSCVNEKKFWRSLSQLEQLLGKKISKSSDPPYLHSLATADYAASYNLRHVLNRLRVWNDEIEGRLLKLRADEIHRYSSFIQKRESENSASTLTSNLLIGEFPRIRRTTLGEYLLLYGQQL